MWPEVNRKQLFLEAVDEQSYTLTVQLINALQLEFGVSAESGY